MFHVKHFSIESLQEEFKRVGIPKFRAMQIMEWIYQKNLQSYEGMTNLPKSLREQLENAYPLFTPSIETIQTSKDKSKKYLLKYHDGISVETVALPSQDGRLTVCVSSQAGCAMACDFCATGKAGFVRNLDPGEIVDQILVVQSDFDEKVTNVVIMGQGEPFLNYDAVIDALRIINHPKLLNIGARHITVSTCGIIKGIERFTQELEQFTLAVSLHAARQEIRDQIMPGVVSQRLGTLRKALDSYTEATGRRVSFEYALMKGINDSDEDLEALKTYCKRMLCHVNLIPLNEIEGSPYKPVSISVMKSWEVALEQSGIPVSIRKSRGSDIAGACGQLRAQHTT